MSDKKKNFGMMTRALHSGWKNDPATGASGLPVYITSAYQFKSTEHAARLFSLAAVLTITASSQPQRRERPVTVPYSCPVSRI